MVPCKKELSCDMQSSADMSNVENVSQIYDRVRASLVRSVNLICAASVLLQSPRRRLVRSYAMSGVSLRTSPNMQERTSQCTTLFSSLIQFRKTERWMTLVLGCLYRHCVRAPCVVVWSSNEASLKGSIPARNNVSSILLMSIPVTVLPVISDWLQEQYCLAHGWQSYSSSSCISGLGTQAL